MNPFRTSTSAARSDGEDLTSRLRREIRQGRLRPGSRLVQSQIAQEFGVSRIPVREALKALAGEGLVVMERGLGATVAVLSAQDALDLYDLRLAVEPPLASAITTMAGPRDLRDLDRYVREMELSLDQYRFSDLNHAFHVALYRISDKPTYVRFVTHLLTAIEPYSRMYLHLLGGTARAQHEHREMVRAVRERDHELLASQIRNHLAGARDALLDTLPGDEPE